MKRRMRVKPEKKYRSSLGNKLGTTSSADKTVLPPPQKKKSTKDQTEEVHIAQKSPLSFSLSLSLFFLTCAVAGWTIATVGEIRRRRRRYPLQSSDEMEEQQWL